LVDEGFCDSHAELSKQTDRWRGTSASRGYDRQWRNVRERVLQRDKYLCQRCLRAKRVTPAAEVHHKLKLAEHPELRLIESNLESLCIPCHKEADRK
jgi:5-methylcytosine-specific restriction enzyme A